MPSIVADRAIRIVTAKLDNEQSRWDNPVHAAMAKAAHVYRLESFGLTLAGLTRLGARVVHATVQLSGKTAQQLRPLRPAERQRVQRATLVRQLARLRQTFPEATFAPRDRRKPWTIDATLPARKVAALASAPPVAHVFLTAVAGRAPARRPPTCRSC